MTHLYVLGNTPVDYLVEVGDEFLSRNKLKKGDYIGIAPDVAVKFKNHFKRLSKIFPGGSSANVAANFARFGFGAIFQGTCGNDPAAGLFEESLTDAGVKTLMIKKDGPQGIMMTFITPDGERTFAGNLLKSTGIKPWQLDYEMIETSKIFHTSGFVLHGNEGAVFPGLVSAKDSSSLISFDASSPSLVRKHKDSWLDLVDRYVNILFLNEDEASAFLDEDTTLPEIFDMFTPLVDVFVYKLGAKGSLAVQDGRLYYVLEKREWNILSQLKSYDTRSGTFFQSLESIVNTNGAGDTFTAGFLASVFHGRLNLSELNLRVATNYARRIVQQESARYNRRITFSELLQ